MIRHKTDMVEHISPLGFKRIPNQEYQRIASNAASVKSSLTHFIPCSSKLFNCLTDYKALLSTGQNIAYCYI